MNLYGKWDKKILKALLAYKEVYGNLSVPRDFCVPFDNPEYPISTSGMPLGDVVYDIRTKKTFFQNYESQLLEIGF